MFLLLGILLSLTSAETQPVMVAPELQELEQNVLKTVAAVKDSVIAIEMRSKNGQTIGSGSGVIVSAQGLILTAAHVVDGLEEVIAITADQKEHKVKVLGMNRYKDAAVCRMDDSTITYPFSPLGDSDSLQVTDWVIAMGHGRGYDKTRTAPVRFGRIRAHNPGRFVTSDCPLIGGDSGGPLFDLQGHVVAINSSINGLAKFNVHAGVSGFKDDMVKMRSGERWGQLLPNVLYTPETPVIGITWPESARSLYQRSAYTRPKVNNVISGGPAAAAGLQAGDLITKIADEDVASTQDVAIALGRQKVGDTITVSFQRERKLYQTDVTLAARQNLSAEKARRIDAPRLRDNEDSPYVKEQDKPRLAQQAIQIFQWADPLAEKRADTYVQLYSVDNTSTPFLHATVIKDGLAVAPLSAFKSLPPHLMAWRPGIDAHSVHLIGGYAEHDLALLSIPGLKANHNLLELGRAVEVGEFIGAMSNTENKNSIIKLGVISVKERFLTGLLGVSIMDHGHELGAAVSGTSPGGTAYKLGVRRGSIITKLNDTVIKDAKMLKDTIQALKVGASVYLEFTHNGQHLTGTSTLGAKSSSEGRIKTMDRLGRNTLSQNTDTFQSVIQSDILVEPEECGSPIFALDGSFIGIAMSDAGRNKTYLISSETLKAALNTEPQEITVQENTTINRDRKSTRIRHIPSTEAPRLKQPTLPRSSRDPFRQHREFMDRLFRENGARTAPSELLEELERMQEEVLKNLGR